MTTAVFRTMPLSDEALAHRLAFCELGRLRLTVVFLASNHGPRQIAIARAAGVPEEATEAVALELGVWLRRLCDVLRLGNRAIWPGAKSRLTLGDLLAHSFTGRVDGTTIHMDPGQTMVPIPMSPFLGSGYQATQLTRAKDEMWWATAKAADIIEETGENGKVIAHEIRARARDLWTEYQGTPPRLAALLYKAADWAGSPVAGPIGVWLSERIYQGLAYALWKDKVGQRPKAAIVRAVLADRLLPVMTRQLPIPEIDDGVIRDRKGKRIGAIVLGSRVVFATVRSGLDRLGSVAGHRLIRALVHRAHDGFARGGDGRPGRVAFVGGWEGLADAIRFGTRDWRALRELAEAGQAVQWETAHAIGGGLWTWSERRGVEGRPGEVAFVLGDCLLPGFAAALARGDRAHALSARMARRLIPELRTEPPVAAAPARFHGAVWNLHRIVLVELVDRAVELHRQGGISIPEERWCELADQARLPRGLLAAVRASFLCGDGDAPPFLGLAAAGLWTLADQHAPERAFIAEAGRRRDEGGANARLAVARKSRRRSRG